MFGSSAQTTSQKKETGKTGKTYIRHNNSVSDYRVNVPSLPSENVLLDSSLIVFSLNRRQHYYYYFLM